MPPTREQVLARACDYAGCTRAQARALHLRARGYSIREIAGELEFSYQQARHALENGRERLEWAFSAGIRRRLNWYRVVIACLKNHQDCRPAPVLTWAPIPGGYDSVPVTVRARPHGLVAEDLIENTWDFLRLLLKDLA